MAEARAVEAESTSSSKAKSQQITGCEDSKLDLILKISKMEADVKQLQEAKPEKVSTSVDTRKPVKCTKCHLDGHLYWGCRKHEDVACNRCGAKGHMANCCHKKKALN